MEVVARRRWTMWLAGLVAVAVLAGATIAQISVLPGSTGSTSTASPTKVVTPVRPPLVSPIQP
jgi:hypothetical protein